MCPAVKLIAAPFRSCGQDCNSRYAWLRVIPKWRATADMLKVVLIMVPPRDICCCAARERRPCNARSEDSGKPCVVEDAGARQSAASPQEVRKRAKRAKPYQPLDPLQIKGDSTAQHCAGIYGTFRFNV